MSHDGGDHTELKYSGQSFGASCVDIPFPLGAFVVRAFLIVGLSAAGGILGAVTSCPLSDVGLVTLRFRDKEGPEELLCDSDMPSVISALT